MSAIVLEDQEISTLVAFGLHETVVSDGTRIVFTDVDGFHVRVLIPGDEPLKTVGEVEYLSATELGRVLLTQNVRSVVHRYQGMSAEEMQGYSARIAGYKYTDPRGCFLSEEEDWAAEIIMACRAYTYQAGETGDLEETEAGRWVKAIHDKAAYSLAQYQLSRATEM